MVLVLRQEHAVFSWVGLVVEGTSIQCTWLCEAEECASPGTAAGTGGDRA